MSYWEADSDGKHIPEQPKQLIKEKYYYDTKSVQNQLSATYITSDINLSIEPVKRGGYFFIEAESTETMDATCFNLSNFRIYKLTGKKKIPSRGTFFNNSFNTILKQMNAIADQLCRLPHFSQLFWHLESRSPNETANLTRLIMGTTISLVLLIFATVACGWVFYNSKKRSKYPCGLDKIEDYSSEEVELQQLAVERNSVGYNIIDKEFNKWLSKMGLARYKNDFLKWNIDSYNDVMNLSFAELFQMNIPDKHQNRIMSIIWREKFKSEPARNPTEINNAEIKHVLFYDPKLVENL